MHIFAKHFLFWLHKNANLADKILFFTGVLRFSLQVYSNLTFLYSILLKIEDEYLSYIFKYYI
jgi:hypothetical protein